MKTFKSILSVIVLFFALVLLTGCAPKDPAAAREKLEKKEYTVVVDGTVIPAALKLLGAQGVESVLTASKKVENKDEKTTISVTCIYFDSKDNAKASLKSIQNYAKKQGYETTVKQSGTWLFFGDAQAMKDFN